MEPVKSYTLLMYEKMLRKDLEKEGYQVIKIDDRWRPRIKAVKANHFNIEAIRFLDPSSHGFSVSGCIGTDIHKVFCFRIMAPFDNVKKRYEKMMTAMRPFIEREIDLTEVRMDF